MSLYTALCSHVLFPLHESAKGHASVGVRRRLEQSQWWSPQQLEAQRLATLRGFLSDIGARVPYYRALFKQLGFDPSTVASLRDLQALPLLTKADIRSHLDALKADGHAKLSRYNTGGSSGQPLIFYIGKDRTNHDVGAKWRVTRWWGVDIGDPEMVIWGSPIELGTQDRLRRLRDRVLRSVLLPAFEMSEAKLDGFVAEIRRCKPRMLFGYPSALTHIARHAEKRGVALNDLGIKVAFVTSERLYDEQRATISRAFGCPVANGYGGRDAGFIAHECPSGGMHVMAEDIIVELVDGDGHPVPDGHAGEIVVTHMATADFPFVRYRTGDIAVAQTGTCKCGRGLPMLREIQGRTTDFVVAADGTVMHGLALIYVLREQTGIESFKVIQETRLLTRVEVVADPTFDAQAIPRIVAAFRKRLGAEVDVQVHVVDQIPAESSGKYRYIVSHALTASNRTA
ncbi:MAG TPA: AMP-binding protein, partial [Chloroflexota bacterium]|nr:AMP-binding protein [Chloroflexota bacterium]